MPHDLLARNATWAEAKEREDPGFFARSARGQAPKHLWIGCADSRQPAATISGAGLGELFVHRNIANLCVHSDLSMLSVLEFAVNVLEVRDIIVCGHHGCGGVEAALSGRAVGLIDNWLRHIRDVRDQHASELAGIDDPALQLDRLCELNAMRQARHVAESSIVQAAWARGRDLTVRAWIYQLRSGRLVELDRRYSGQADVQASHRLIFD